VLIHIALFVALMLLLVIPVKADIAKMEMGYVLKTANLDQLILLPLDLLQFAQNAKIIFLTVLNAHTLLMFSYALYAKLAPIWQQMELV